MNWQKIILDLEASGLTQTEIGERVGCTQVHVSHIKTKHRGKRVGFDLGMRLQSLWSERCATAETEHKTMRAINQE